MTHFGRGFHEAECHACPPGTECHANGGTLWETYTNSRDDVMLSWAKPLESVSQLKELVKKGHITVLWDEIHQDTDRRRPMKRGNIDVGNAASLSRKQKVKFFATAQSVDKIEGRIVNEAKVIMLPWNPDGEAKRIGAAITIRGDGRLPPWKRTSQRPFIKIYNTAESRKWYDTYEVVESISMGGEAADPVIFMPMPDGNGGEAMQPVTYSEAIQWALVRYLYENAQDEAVTLTARHLEDYMAGLIDTDPPIEAAFIDNALLKYGYRPKGKDYYFPAGVYAA